MCVCVTTPAALSSDRLVSLALGLRMCSLLLTKCSDPCLTVFLREGIVAQVSNVRAQLLAASRGAGGDFQSPPGRRSARSFCEMLHRRADMVMALVLSAQMDGAACAAVIASPEPEKSKHGDGGDASTLPVSVAMQRLSRVADALERACPATLFVEAAAVAVGGQSPAVVASVARDTDGATAASTTPKDDGASTEAPGAASPPTSGNDATASSVAPTCDAVLASLRTLRDELQHGITGFEFRGSGVAASLLRFLTCRDTAGRSGVAAALERRCRQQLFARVFLYAGHGSDSDSDSPAVQQLATPPRMRDRLGSAGSASNGGAGSALTKLVRLLHAAILRQRAP